MSHGLKGWNYHMRSNVLWAFLLVSLVRPGYANEVPKFTPNVVDPGQVLSQEEVGEIDSALQSIREKAGILGAVFLVDKLEDDTIETLAVKAFQEWKLGSKGKDNGLLLVLAMKDRKSRFEVGYGLEGELTDVVSRRVLDDVLRPYMRKGETKNAIVKSFSYLSAVKLKEPVEVPAGKKNELDTKMGMLGLLLFLFCLWIVRPLTEMKAIASARRLARDCTEYKIESDKARNQGRMTFRHVFFGRWILPSLGIRAFLSLNPGLFIFFGSALNKWIFDGLAAACLLVSLIYYRVITGKYRSRESYLAYLDKLKRRNQRMVDKGYMRETSPGEFEYTKAYYSSSEYRASRSSSSGSSSSSSSSSSGGGSSGGGGASSDW